MYHDLLEKGYTHDEVADLFRALAPHMTAPLTDDSPWLKIRSKVFQPGSSAPASRRQDMKNLTDEIAEWIDPGDRAEWLMD